jgi:MOSC domain-containing protein YiiM
MPHERHYVGQVAGIAVRTGPGAAMRELKEATACAGGGLSGDNPSSPRRGVTLLCAPQWRQVNTELGTSLPWHTRRANLLVDCPTLEPLIGLTVAIGQVKIRIEGETKPCSVMDAAHAGLMTALKINCRGGVHGRIITDGVMRVGDPLVLIEE